MKEKGNVLSISKMEFIKLVSKRSKATQYVTENVLEAMQEVLTDLFQDVEQYDKIKVRVSKDIQMGAVMRRATRRRIPNTGEMVDVPEKCEPYCKFLSSFLDAVRETNPTYKFDGEDSTIRIEELLELR